MREKIDCLEGECFAYLLPRGWPGIYSICFSQLDGSKDSFSLARAFPILIAIRLIRDNYEAIIENYPTSLICEIWFDLQDKQLLGIILLPLMMRFGLIYRIWAFQAVRAIGPWGDRTGLLLWAGARSPDVSMSLPFSWAW